MKCKICNNIKDNQKYEVKEMMLGLREKFTYFQCSSCKCLQILEIPNEIYKYYPENYYSYSLSSNNKSKKKKKNIFKIMIKGLKDRIAILNKGYLGKLTYKHKPNKSLRILSQIKKSKNQKILDIGCGDGKFLSELKKLGFKNLLGVDPYIKEDIQYENGLKILKKQILDIHGKWDLIMFHHSFEHIANPIETIKHISKLLSDKGTCLIRVLTVTSYAWEHYRENWVQLDAPRHLFLYSIESIKILAEKAELVVDNIIYDSESFQFWGSEQYLKDIPLKDPKSFINNKVNPIFSKEEISEFKKKAKKLNSDNRGDSCAFFLKKKKS